MGKKEKTTLALDMTRRSIKTRTFFATCDCYYLLLPIGHSNMLPIPRIVYLCLYYIGWLDPIKSSFVTVCFTELVIANRPFSCFPSRYQLSQ